MSQRSWRTEVNLRAMRLALAKEPGELTAEDHQTLAQYSGWGGLSIKRAASALPVGWVPEKKALIHEYYTPELVANAIAQTLLPYQPELTNAEGNIRVLEPSAGIGRFVNALDPILWPQLKWTAIELSKVSASLLSALRPDITLVHAPFEQWVQDNKHLFGVFDLVVCNPPWLPARPTSVLEQAVYDEDSRMLRGFLAGLAQHLEEGGEAGSSCPISPNTWVCARPGC